MLACGSPSRGGARVCGAAPSFLPGSSSSETVGEVEARSDGLRSRSWSEPGSGPGSVEVEEGCAVRIGVLGTGTVGRALSGKLAVLGHEAWVGTRDVDAA